MFINSYPDEHLNLQFITELLVHFVLTNEYDAISRSFLIRVTTCLSISYTTFLALERSLLAYLSIAASRSGKDNWEIEEDAKKVSVKGKWWKIGAAAAAGSLIVFAGHFSLLYLSLAPVLLPAAAALLQTLTGMAAVIGGSTAITTAIVSALSATSAFLASSAGLTVFSAGLLAGGAGYAGYE